MRPQLTAANCNLGCFLVVFLLIAFSLEAFGGAFYAVFRADARAIARKQARIDRERQTAPGVVTAVQRNEHFGSENSRTVDYAATIVFNLPSGQRFTMGRTAKNVGEFTQGQRLTVEYAASDPMLNRLPADRNGDATSRFVGVFATVWLLFLPALVLLPGLRRAPQALPFRLVGLVLFVVAGVVGSMLGGRLSGGFANRNEYTLQVGDTTLLGNHITYGNDVRVSDTELVVLGKRYPAPPNHAHIWLKNGLLRINNRTP